jgi:fatty-acyl-CoA synthase
MPEMESVVTRAAKSTVTSLFLMRAQVHPMRIAIDDGARALTYAELATRVRRLAGLLAARGVKRGDRIALLSENRAELLEVVLAAGSIGAAVALQSWRLAPPEIEHCVKLVEPSYILASPRHAARVNADLVFGDRYEEALGRAKPTAGSDVDPEDALVILYTSGTTGLPKGAVLSHRAEIVRNLVVRADFGVANTDTFVAWSPLYHMGALEPSLGALMSGGTVVVVDGFDRQRLVSVVAEKEIGWLLLMPGMVASFIEEVRARNVTPRGVKVCGVMADLVPPHEIAEVTQLLNAPYANTFGATETGCPPCSSNLIPVGVVPAKLSKEQSAYCEIRLLDPEGKDVPDGAPGELAMRGPTLFSGYFRADEANAHDFRDGWFHMGDVFVRNPDGTLDFVDRVKYLIKSGGENVYPAEIERVIQADPRVAEVAVVRRKDAKWGEVPVAFVARRDESLTEDEIRALCKQSLASFKQPKDVRFIALDAFPRSASGKVQRHLLEGKEEKA